MCRLDVVEFSALSKNNEVSLAALKAFQEILYSNSADQVDPIAEEVRNEMWLVRVFFSSAMENFFKKVSMVEVKLQCIF